jgi:TolB-like 6-blade propeller-like
VLQQAGYLAIPRWLVPVALAAALVAGAAAQRRSRAHGPESGAGGAPCASPGLRGSEAVLSATVLSEASSLAIPTRLIVDGPWIFVLDAASDSVLHQFRLEDGTLYQSLGRRGRGPGEFRGAWSLSQDPSSGDAWVYDISLARLTRIVVPRGDSRPAYAGPSIQLTAEGTATDAVWLDSTRLVVPGFFQDARVAILDGSGRRVAGLGPSFTQWSSTYPQVSQARMEPHPDGHLAVLANRHLASIDLVDLERSTTTAVQAPVALPRGSGPEGLDAVAYVDVAVTATSIFALFSGRGFSRSGQDASFGNCIHEYGWDGGYRRSLGLDGDVIAIAVTEDGSALYALRHEPRPALVRFDLTVVSLAFQ